MTIDITAGPHGRNRANQRVVALRSSADSVVTEGSEGSKGSGDDKALLERNILANDADNELRFREGSVGFRESGPWLPHGFKPRSSGGIDYIDSEEKPQFLCSKLEVVAATRNTEGEEWGRLLRVTDRDNIAHDWAMPMSSLAGNGEAYRSRLLSMGLELAPGSAARNALQRLLTTAKPPERVRCVAGVGWHGTTFLLPDAAIGPSNGEWLVLQAVAPLAHNYRRGGTLDGWKTEIASLAVGNSRLMLALSMAFAGPLLGLIQGEGGGVHFRGASSTGKTTLAEAAGSACGGGRDGFKTTWRATDNGLEGTAAAHNHGLLVLDEIGQVSADALGEVAYMLANGQPKRRSHRDGSARRADGWLLLFLSTGEVSLADKLRESRRNGGRVMAGQQVRVLDLPADAGAGHGVFETLHGHASGQALSNHLKAAAQRHYGHALREFRHPRTITATSSVCGVV